MSGRIYALLIGINRYADAPNPKDTPEPLRGCVNDVRVFKEYLEQKSRLDGVELSLQELLDEAATRAAVINGFRSHLCQAKSGDTVVVYYSGHGSQEKVSPELKEFLKLNINYLETLVCWDSRTENGSDLANKELAVLIAEVSQNHPQIVVILDSCHSGGALRNNSVGRWFPNRQVDRPLSSFIFAEQQVEDLFLSVNLDRTKVNWLTGLERQYILLAACRSDQLAIEHPTENRGLFSYFLTNSLYQTNSQVSYRDIFNRTNVRVQTAYLKQSPQITATNSDDLDLRFLGGGVSRQNHYFTVSYGDEGWIIDGGLLHGVQANSHVEKTRLAVFPLEVDNLRQLSLAIATAETIEVLPQLSKLNIAVEKEDLDRQLTYKAVVTSSPLSPVRVYLDGDEWGVNLARQAIQTASFGEQKSLYICEVDKASAELHLVIRDNRYTVFHPEKERVEITTENAISAIQALEHIARWKNINNLASPPNSRIPASGVQLQIYGADDVEIQTGQIRLEYRYIDNKWQPPAFKVKLTNRTQETLYCTLLNLTELYTVKSIPMDTELVICLEPGAEIWAFDAKLIQVCIPEDMLQSGTTEYKDILKLICNTSHFEAYLLEQTNITSSINRSHQRSFEERPIVKSDLVRLIRRGETRAIEASRDDWITSEVLITTVIAAALIENQDESLSDPIVVIPGQFRQINSRSDTKHQKLNYLAITSIGSILCLIAIFGFLIWKGSQPDKPSKDRIIDRQYRR
jgi:hypothetical protein